MKKIIVVTITSILLFCGCATTKDRKAITRVTYNSELFNKIGKQWQVSNPCIIDTVKQFINGKEVIKYDTSYANIYDTIYNPVTKIQTIYKTVSKLVNKTDTLITYVIDNRAINIVKEDLSNAQGQITQLQADNTIYKHSLNTRLLWIIGLFIIILFLGFLNLKKL